jgi:hypothetical protein
MGEQGRARTSPPVLRDKRSNHSRLQAVRASLTDNRQIALPVADLSSACVARSSVP